MLLRCKVCDVLLGVRPPFNDWRADRESLCTACAERVLEALPPPPDPEEKPKDGQT